MFQVIVRGPDGSEVTHTLGADQGLIVGRDDGSDIVLPSKRVSRRHARFFTEGETLHVEDLGSQNGVFVGGARINGTAEIRPGPPIEIGEFKIRITRQDPRQLEAVKEVQDGPLLEGYLRGLGEYVGRDIPLPLERGIVGRDKSADVPIENDSVSRKHAEIRLEAGMVHIVTDLGSSNGTFVNGTRLKPNLPQRLRNDDKVRFGETHWQYKAGTKQVAQSGGDRIKKLIGLLGVVIVVVGAGIALKGPGHAREEVVEAQDDDPSMDIASGQEAMDRDDFDSAKKAFEAALEKDPVNSDARQLLRKAESEIGFEKQFHDGVTKMEVGRNDEALKMFFQISPDSRFFARARLKVQEITTASSRRDAGDCRDAARRNDDRRAVNVCSRYLDYKCHTDLDKDALKALRTAESRLKVSDPWQCPQKLAPWFGSGTQVAVDYESLLGQRYADKEIRDGLVMYVKSDIDGALRAMSKAKKAGTAEIADQLHEQLVVIAGSFKEGQTAVIGGRLKEGETAFKTALQADARIMPEKVQSYYAKEMRSMLARAFNDAGRAQYDKNSYTEAFELWSRGLEYQPNDSTLLDGLTRLERMANSWLDGSADCDQLRKALHITRDDSKVHEMADTRYQKDCT